jgi:hypothetical protein
VIGSKVVLVPPRPYAAIAALGAAVALVALAVAVRAPFLVPLSLLPAALGLGLLLSGGRRFHARFTATALEIARPPEAIPYATILEVRPVIPLEKSRTPSFAIEVVHRGGSLLIPPTLSVPSARVYAFLRGLLPERPERHLAPALAAYQREQEQSFGADRVSCYGGRRGPLRHPPAWLPAVGKACLIAGLAWIAVPLFRSSEPGWYAAGGSLLILGGVLLAIERTYRTKGAAAQARVPGGAGLVISPVGLAMEQGALNGLLTWQEIRGISTKPPGGAFGTTRDTRPGISIEVEGATFRITDSYDRPLQEIHDRLLQYWR